MIISYLSSAIPWSTIEKQWDFQIDNIHHIVQYNIQSGDHLAVLHQDQGNLSMTKVGFGFGRPPGFTLNNARKEGIFSQSSFRFLIRNQRCLIPLDSFYQVHRHPQDGTTCYRCYIPGKESFLAAGLLNEQGDSVVLITQPSQGNLKDVAERTPVTFDSFAQASRWMQTTNISEVDALMEAQIEQWAFHVTTNELLHMTNSPLLHKPVHKHLTLFD